MSMEFRIGQNDSLPNIYATLTADFDDNVPESEHVVYNSGDTIALYIVKASGVVSRNCSIENVGSGNKSILVKATLTPEDVEVGGVCYKCYFRNNTINLSFPIEGFGKIHVEQKGHDAPQ